MSALPSPSEQKDYREALSPPSSSSDEYDDDDDDNDNKNEDYSRANHPVTKKLPVRLRSYNIKLRGKAQGVKVLKINSDGTVVIQIKGPDLDRLSRLRVLRKDLGERADCEVSPNQPPFIYIHVEPPKGWYSYVWHMVNYQFNDGSSRWLRARIVNPPSEEPTDPERTMLKMNFADFGRHEMIVASRVFSIINIRAVTSIPEQAVTVKVVGLKEADYSPQKLMAMVRVWSESNSVYMITPATTKPRRVKNILTMLTPQGVPLTMAVKPGQMVEDD